MSNVENSLEKEAKIGENIGFSDTGSQILPENQAKSGTNLPNNEEKEQNQPENAENDDFSEENKANFNDFRDFYDVTSINAFKAAYPAVSIESLKENKEFSYLLATIQENPTLLTLYECYNTIFSVAEEKFREKSLQLMAKARAGVGSLASNQPNSHTFYTKEQVLQMSAEQIRENYDKIRASKQKW